MPPRAFGGASVACLLQLVHRGVRKLARRVSGGGHQRMHRVDEVKADEEAPAVAAHRVHTVPE